MTLPAITVADLDTLDWVAAENGRWRIVTDLTCGRCGAYQAADSDPVVDKAKSVELAVRLFNSVGWRATTTHEKKLCPRCASRAKSD